MFIETSAKAGHNVKTLFRKIAQALPGMDREGGEQQQANQSASPPPLSRSRLSLLLSGGLRADPLELVRSDRRERDAD